MQLCDASAQIAVQKFSHYPHFKLIYYSSLTILGYKALSPLEYFPKELGGSGYMAKMFEKKFPDAFFHTKTPLFDLHYLICLSYSFVDLIWLILIDTRQLDFFVMLFHHICTSSLIIFSFVTQYSNVGSIVLFLHNKYTTPLKICL